MLWSLETLRRLTLGALDGEVGHVRDVLFDDEDWRVRYVAADAGQWGFGKRVLLGTEALRAPDPEAGTLEVQLRIQEVREAPETDEGPISRIREIALRRHHGWPAYWKKALTDEGVPVREEADGTLTTGIAAGGPGALDATADAARLYGIRELAGFAASDRDGPFGTIADAMVDVERWTVVYLLVEAPGVDGRLLVSADWTTAIDRAGRTVHLGFARAARAALRPVNLFAADTLPAIGTRLPPG